MKLSRVLVAVPVLCGLSLAAFPVRAEAPATASDASVADAVELKNGGYLRGIIIELEPASHLLLRLPDGQVRRIAVGDIESADRNGKPVSLTGGAPAPATATASQQAATTTAPVGAAPPAAGSSAAVAPPTPALVTERAHEPSELDRILAAIPGPRVQLELHADRTAFLERLIGEPDADAVGYHLVCKLPCRVALPVADLAPYRIANLRLQPTGWFPVPKYDARVHAKLASDMYPIWERSMLIGGFVFGAIGGSFLGINELSGKKEWARDTGYVLAGLGGAFFVTSGIFWLFSPRTSYAVERVR